MALSWLPAARASCRGCASGFSKVEGAMQDEGVVKHIKAEKGYGFIKLASGPDIFFHCSDVDINAEALNVS